MRVIDGATVERYLSDELALEAMRRCFALEAAGQTGAKGRMNLDHSAGWMRVLPAVFEGLGVFGHKIISFTNDAGVRYVVTLFDIASGEMIAVLDAEAITGARTGATAALAAESMCRPEVSVAAVIGTGSVARSQLTALQAVRPVDEIRVFSRNSRNRAEFIAEMQPRLAARLLDTESVEQAIDDAGLVTLATKSPRPVLGRRHLEPGMHVNSVGSARPNLSEVEPDAFAAFDQVVCDSVDLVFGESGDAIAAVRDGLYDPSRAQNLADIVGAPPPRPSDAVTLFKSTGTGLQDLALSVAILEMVQADEAGAVVDDVLTFKRFTETGRT
jgi:alanine dehydrogenase